MSDLPPEARTVLDEGRFCYLAAATVHGPHVTPVVFVLDGDAVWATTARGTAKARAWKTNASAAGLVRHGGMAVSFRGRVTMFDALDTSTWSSAIRRAPDLMRVAARYSLKNARYFAGYARDARSVPLSWMPPARLMIAIEVNAGVVLDLSEGTVARRWGRWGNRVRSRPAFRSVRGSDLSATGAFREIRRDVGTSGRGVLGLKGSVGPVVLPVAWFRSASEGAYYGVLPRSFLALAGAEPSGPGALALSGRASAWRASRMSGLLLQGEAHMFVPGDLRGGRRALLAKAARAGSLPSDPVVVRLKPQGAMWWKGWSSGTVRRR
jgi:Pyridoxamine 5'-phosphate oxidase